MIPRAVEERWNRYWFPNAPLADLAILRIIAVGTQLVLMLLDERYGLKSLVEISKLPAFMYEPMLFLKLLTTAMGGYKFILHDMQIMWFVTVAAGLFSLIGLWTRVMLLVFAAGVSVMQLWVMSHGDAHHPEAAMMLALCTLALAPSGATFSVDWWIRRRRDSRPARSQLLEMSREAKWPLLLLQWIFALMYLSAAYAKIVYGHGHWANGYTLQFYLARDGLRWDSLLGVWLSHYHWLSFFSQWAILIFQSTFVVSMFVPKLKYIYVPIGMAMHIGIYLMLEAPFFQWSALYLVFVPWTSIILEARRAIRGGAEPQFVLEGRRV
ncbi:TQO small subunit DoxD [Novosphingobium sp. 9U]|uniref:TQO small subunit DoxD n=1 Tax=Novosphingobium sp. 9U TaxID=2653158 RepID=UPI0012EEE544|nr:TQO small subunit DoxD [Novosphingobium sp. 9U]VWX50475.1 conserved membrane hypothetical protein [Novosphingobium sp. 9U]